MISKLTPAQEALLPVYLDKWLKVSYNTQPINKEKAIEGIEFMYKLIQKPTPEDIVFVKSPMAAMVLAAARIGTNSQLESQLWSQLWSQLESQLGFQLGSQLESQLGSQLWSQLGSQLESQLWSQLWSQLESQLWSQLESQLWSQLESQLGFQLESQLESQLWSQLGSRLESQLGSQCNWRSYGFYLYDFVLNVIFPEQKKDFVLFEQYLSHMQVLHKFYLWENGAIVVDFPEKIEVVNQKLHSTEGMALRYRDGYGMYAVDGKSLSENEFYQNYSPLGKFLQGTE